MKDWMKLMGLLLSLTVVMAACSSGGGGDDDNDDEGGDSDKAVVEAARAAWPEYTGDLDELIDLSGYTVVTLVPFENLTDNSKDEDAGEDFIDEVEDYLNERYEDVFVTVRVADDALGQPDEAVIRGHVYDYSKAHYSYFTGRTKNKFKAEMSVTNGATGEVLKSARIKEDSRYEGRDEMIEEAAKEVAKMLARSKTNAGG